MRRHIWIAILVVGVGIGRAWADPGSLIVKVDQPGVKISPTFYGLMTEEINHSYDGGLYAELIQNRIFKDDPQRPVHWSLVKAGDADGTITLDSTSAVNDVALTTSLKLDVTKAGQRVGIANEGYWGIPVQPNTTYRASFYAKAQAGGAQPLTVSIESNDGSVVHATATVPTISATWQQYTVTLKTGAQAKPSKENRFVISTSSPGTIWFNLVSLFPPTFNDRANGNRIDLMQALLEMHPTFLRLPGGNYLEGNTVDERFNWKKTIGPLDQRPGHQGPWQYRSSDGMGLLEFMEWCEDLKVEPVLAVFAGYALRGERIQPGIQLAPFVQDSLDEIEYLSGDKSTKWGAERAKNGHPEPFKLRYVEIGNEDNFDRTDSYDGRFAQFAEAIKAKYPEMQLIATTKVRTRTPDLMDDHFYRSSRAMQQDVKHYDRINRNGPKIFVGEWATTEGNPTPTMNAALGDAAWLTGLERNSDLVVMQCYAPLFVNVNKRAAQWATNLIGYDAASSFASPSYYVQKMFAENRGDTVLPVEIKPQAIPEPAEQPMPHGAIGLSTWATKAEYKDIKVTGANGVLYQSDFLNGMGNWARGDGDWTIEEGALRQSSNLTDCRATIGDDTWTDYTIRLKARKLGGEEGFLILFHVKDPGNYIWWNVGGWTNTRTALERAENGARGALGPSFNMRVENDRWYDIRIDVRGRGIRCYLDDKLITEATDNPVTFVGGMYAAASREDSSGDVILKVVNSLPTVQQIQIDLQGIGNVNKNATIETLSGQPLDVNTIDQPQKVVPQRSQITDAAPKFVHEFAANSVNVIRLKTRSAR